MSLTRYDDQLKQLKKASQVSEGETILDAHLRMYKVEFEREYRFHLVRKWRFDFALPERKLAIEVEGGGSNGMAGRHQTRTGFAGDCTKYNRAAIMGWMVLRYPTEDVKNGVAIAEIMEVLGRRN